MPVPLVALVVPRGLPSFRCPVTGVPAWTEEGFDEEDVQSPYLRFFVDWIGQAWVVPPSVLAGEAAAEQRAKVASLQVFNDDDNAPTQDEQMRQLAESLSQSAGLSEFLCVKRG